MHWVRDEAIHMWMTEGNLVIHSCDRVLTRTICAWLNEARILAGPGISPGMWKRKRCFSCGSCISKIRPLPLSSGISNRGEFHTKSNFGFARVEFQSWDFVLNVAMFNELVNASSSLDYSFFDCVAFPAALSIATNLRSELRTLFGIAILLLQSFAM